MSTRRWIVVGVAVALELGVAALYWFNVNLTTDSADMGQRVTPVWIVHPGETLTVASDEVGEYDRYRCRGAGSLFGTPEPGDRSVSDGLAVETAEDGTVTVRCEVKSQASV